MSAEASRPTAGAESGAAGLVDRSIADMTGGEALPRKNGELVFDAAWQGRTFGMTLALHRDCRFHWDEFRDRLIAEIADAERSGADSTYYDRWFAAFEKLLADKALVSREELDARAAAITRGERDDAF